MRRRVQETALVVEPDVIQQKELSAALKQLGYEVMVTGVYADAVQVRVPSHPS